MPSGRWAHGLTAVAPTSAAVVGSDTMPVAVIPPYPWKFTIELFDAFDKAVRAEDLAAARDVLEKNREVIEKVREELA